MCLNQKASWFSRDNNSNIIARCEEQKWTWGEWHIFVAVMSYTMSWLTEDLKIASFQKHRHFRNAAADNGGLSHKQQKLFLDKTPNRLLLNRLIKKGGKKASEKTTPHLINTHLLTLTTPYGHCYGNQKQPEKDNQVIKSDYKERNQESLVSKGKKENISQKISIVSVTDRGNGTVRPS